MTINLHRLPLLILTIAITALFVLVNRVGSLARSSFTTGEVTGIKITHNEKRGGDYKYHARIVFTVDSKEFSFYGGDFTERGKGESVEIIYETDNPQNASVYNFKIFWLIPILYGVIPIVVVCVLAFSFMGRWDKFVLSTKNGISYSRISRRLDSEIEQSN
jgi:hypothetical protein